jgi:hypothetical protein
VNAKTKRATKKRQARAMQTRTRTLSGSLEGGAGGIGCCDGQRWHFGKRGNVFALVGQALRLLRDLWIRRRFWRRGRRVA